MVSTKRRAILGLLLSCTGCVPSPRGEQSDPAEVEAAVRQFAVHVSQYNYEGIRGDVTPDFEMIEGGVRMDLDGFTALLRRMEARNNRLDFEPSEFNTEVFSDVAYTSLRDFNRSSGSQFLESAILHRSGDQWLIDRFFSARVPDP